MFLNAKAWKTEMAPNVLLSYSSSLCKIKIYDCVMLKYSYKSDWYSLTNKPSDPNVEKYFHEGPRKNYYHPNGYINIKQYFIILFYFSLSCLFLIFYQICTYKKVISFSTSYGNWSSPWPVQLIWTSWHWQPDAISEHMKSEIHCYKEFKIFTIQCKIVTKSYNNYCLRRPKSNHSPIVHRTP